MPALSVVVPARNAEATLGRTLEAIATQRFDRDWETIVVDDGSTDATVDIARSVPGVKLLRQQSLGPAVARNRGAEEARGDLLAFTDADCFPTAGWLAAGAAALESADLVQGAVRPDPDAEIGPFDRTLWVVAEVGLYETANLLVRREWFDRVGGFEEWFEPRVGKAMAEDVWFGWRARRAGARTAFSEEALVHHAVFDRDPVGYVDERRRLEHFPAMVAKMPELRDTLCWNGAFLSKRTAAFDLAVAGMAAAGATRSKLPLLAALPYAALSWRRSRSFGRRRAPVVAAVDAAADAVGLGALALGSADARSVLL
jgi:glycosyltransferase involved in cell wall biosynthesis